MQNMTIGDTARQAGVRPSTIRYYESIGLLPVPYKVNGQRRYDPAILQTLGVIQLAQHAGFTISEIETLFNDFSVDTPASARWQALATTKLTEIEALIKRANAMKHLLEALLDCRCQKLEDCVGPQETVS